jgi:hypothetical protein
MNILNKQCKALAPTFGAAGGAVSKVKKFTWATPGDPGTFKRIDKQLLNIEGSYQREEVTKQKVIEIARDWDWKLFGCISVARRPDGSLWVYDGGHRTRAAFYRDDITEIPCMVFNVANEQLEAKAFLGANTMKSNVSAFHKHRAAVKTGEVIACAAQSILDKHGYQVTQAAKRKYSFAAIHSLHAQLKKDRVLAEKVFAAAVTIAQDGEPISGEVIDALFACQRKLAGKADILTNGYLETLQRTTIPGIEMAIRREKHIVGQGGEVIAAKAVLDILNKGKKRRLFF